MSIRLRRSFAWPMVAAGLFTGSLSAQDISRDEYLQYVPLSYPTLVNQTPASLRQHLYGDPADPSYRDANPLDGIDDTRGLALQFLAQRFAPFLVQNTTAMPMDFKLFIEDASSFPLYVDTWDISRSSPRLVASDSIEFVGLQSAPCTTEAPAASDPADDCRLLALIEEFRPEAPTDLRARTITRNADPDLFKVMFFDFPGNDEKTWKEEYENSARDLPEKYERFAKTYVHPFIHEVLPPDGGGPGLELVFQFWFFYPWNDGGNNHEGDWEHVNIVVAPRERVTALLTREEIEDILENFPSYDVPGNPKELVLKRVEYYFHSKVIILDFSQPNVYVPRDEWENEVAELAEDDPRKKWFWQQVRYMAYWSDAETLDVINTHPIGYIGADNKGTDQLLAMPGGRNRDSHGTYPYRGLYKNVGPAGAAEEISAKVDIRDYLASESVQARGGIWTPILGPRSATHGTVQPFDVPEHRIEIVPDWERVGTLVREDAGARYDWGWLVLPIRWGYPAVPSPFAGIISHAETGNISVVGPAHNSGWNRIGASAGYSLYDPYQFSPIFALGWQDGFQNELGFLNFTLPTLVMLPPFDFVWRVLAAPFRLLSNPAPVFYGVDEVPFRFVGLGAGASVVFLPDEYAALLFDDAIIGEIAGQLPSGTLPPGDGDVSVLVDNAWSPLFEISFFVGRNFSSMNMLRNSRSTVGLNFGGAGPPAEVRSTLNFWEYSGSLRWSFLTKAVQPYVVGGYGLSWYRLENISVDGQELSNPNSPWVRQPSLFNNLLPNTWHLGAGIELVALNNAKPGFRGPDLSGRVEFAWYWNNLGVTVPQSPPAIGATGNPSTTRPSLKAVVTLSF